MIASDLEFVAAIHDIVASQSELADMLSALVDLANENDINTVPVAPVLLLKLAVMIRVSNELTLRLVEENQQFLEGLKKIEDALTRE